MIYESLSKPVTIVTLQLIDYVSFCLLNRGGLLEKMDGKQSSWQSPSTIEQSEVKGKNRGKPNSLL